MLNIETFNLYDLNYKPNEILATFPTLRAAFNYCERTYIHEYRITNSKGEVVARHEKINKQNHVLNAVYEIIRHCEKCKSCEECIYHYTRHIDTFGRDYDEIHCPFCFLDALEPSPPSQWNTGALSRVLSEQKLFGNWR